MVVMAEMLAIFHASFAIPERKKEKVRKISTKSMTHCNRSEKVLDLILMPPSSGNKFKFLIVALLLLILILIGEGVYFLFFRQSSSSTTTPLEREITLPDLTSAPVDGDNPYLSKINREMEYLKSFYDTDTIPLVENAKLDVTVVGTVYSVEPQDEGFLLIIFDDSYKGAYISLSSDDLQNLKLTGIGSITELQQGDVVSVRVQTDFVNSGYGRTINIVKR